MSAASKRSGGKPGPVARLRAARRDLRTVKAQVKRTLAATRAMQADVSSLGVRMTELAARLDELSALDEVRSERLLHALRTVRDDDNTARERLWALRADPNYAEPFDVDEPLVTVIVPTWRNWRALRDRCLPSLLAQTYPRFEIIVVGDDAPPETADVVAGFGDDRIRYINLPYRGPYPESKDDAWLISGSTPYNVGLENARGLWIACNGDDDALVSTHLESLLRLAREQRAEVAYGAIRRLEPGGDSSILWSWPPAPYQWGMQAALFHRGLRFMSLHTSDWLFRIPNDVSLMERMLRIGVRFAATEEPVLDYYPSQLWD
jgi:hypothetical protein